jgi:hypothetical protein
MKPNYSLALTLTALEIAKKQKNHPQDSLSGFTQVKKTDNTLAPKTRPTKH